MSDKAQFDFKIVIPARPSKNGPPQCILFYFEKRLCGTKIRKKIGLRIQKIQNNLMGALTCGLRFDLSHVSYHKDTNVIMH